MKMRLAVAVCLLTLVAGCGHGPTTTTPRSYSADQLVLRVAVVNGFIPPSVRLAELPRVSIYGDGRVITVGATPAIFPGPALPSLQLQHISAADLNGLVDRAVAAGVGANRDLGQPEVADAPSTRFTVLADPTAAPRVTSVPALGIGGTDGLSRSQRNARSALQDLSEALGNLSHTLGPVQPYLPTALAAVSTAWSDPGLPAPAERAWPGPALPGADAGWGLGCVAVAGPAAVPVLSAAATANSATPWTSAGARWTVTFRPLLPDETGCADLGH